MKKIRLRLRAESIPCKSLTLNSVPLKAFAFCSRQKVFSHGRWRLGWVHFRRHVFVGWYVAIGTRMDGAVAPRNGQINAHSFKNNRMQQKRTKLFDAYRGLALVGGTLRVSARYYNEWLSRGEADDMQNVVNHSKIKTVHRMFFREPRSTKLIINNNMWLVDNVRTFIPHIKPVFVLDGVWREDGETVGICHRPIFDAHVSAFALVSRSDDVIWLCE